MLYVFKFWGKSNTFFVHIKTPFAFLLSNKHLFYTIKTLYLLAFCDTLLAKKNCLSCYDLLYKMKS